MDKVVVNYPPVHMPRPNPERVAQLRAEWSHDGGPIIGFAHRFVEEKRPDLAIRALEVINQTYPHARLVFAGDYQIAYENTWERQQALVQQYQAQLKFLGLLTTPQDVADFYAACDVLLLTSDSECFALAQVEAMLCGTPVVATNIPGGRVPVTVTGMGRIAEKGDWRSIGEAVVEVLQTPDRYAKLRADIERIFSFKDTVDRYESLFTTYARGH
jgi:glycosyltransferase involved in cell wall biosynthesis